jgi:serine/threonine-protein kinase
MGEVYRATDTNLKRQVAVKVLPQAMAGDPDRLVRFQREAEVLAALNHPNIAHIYGLERQEGREGQDRQLALVMELVEGPTLADILGKSQVSSLKSEGRSPETSDLRLQTSRALPLAEALVIARQIAEALEAAHEQGIIHRDLKPANIKIRDDGTVKVLDFGLAKMLDPVRAEGSGQRADAANVTASPTITTPAMTEAGIILGTAAYMSPEQAKGRPADKRSDIWAFGCVLYEMLTGHRAFDGDSVSDILASVLAREPDWTTLPAAVPAHIRLLLQRCLTKERRQRIADISVARFLMNEAPGLLSAQGTTVPPSPASASRRAAWSRFGIPAAALVVGGLTAGATMWLFSRPAAPAVNRWMLTPTGAAAPGRVNIVQDTVAISPDGRRLVYVAGGSLFERALDELEPVRVATSQASIMGSPFVSPDNQWIGFGDTVWLRKVTVTGGPAVPICETDGNLRGASWNPDGTIIFATNNLATGLQRVSSNGGQPTVLTKPNRDQGEGDHLFPQVLPGGQAVLFTILPTTGGIENAQVAVLDLRTGTQKVVVRGGGRARYVTSGHLVYAVSGGLRAVGFNLDSLETRGTPTPVATGVVNPSPIAADFDVSGDGTLFYITGGAQGVVQRSLVWVDRQGREEAIETPLRAYTFPRLSPDGRQVALDIRDQESDIWILDLGRNVLRRLTFDPGVDGIPAWTPDGSRVLFNSQVGGGARELFWQSADGRGKAERLIQSAFTESVTSVTKDGRQAVLYETAASRDIKLLSLDDGHEIRPLIATPSDERNGDLSPDNRWLAYDSNESGQFEVYVRPFPDVNSGRWQVSSGGGSRPLWSRDGRELFYLGPNSALMSVPVNAGPAWSAGTAIRLFQGPYFAGAPDQTARTYDVTPDGKRFLMIRSAAAGEQASESLVVVQNWSEELKRRVPLK